MDVSRSEGTVNQAGDAFSAANMNNLEQRIKTEFDSVNSSLVDVIQEVELWSQNSSSFEAQTITINNLSTYKRIGIYWAVYSTNFATMYTEIPIYSFNSVGSVLSFYGENHHWRHLRINENDIVFSDGKINTSTETRSAVPMKIIGIK